MTQSEWEPPCDRISLGRCPVCGLFPRIVAYDREGNELDRKAFVESGGSVVPNDTFRSEFVIWRMSNACSWGIVCGCPGPMVSEHRIPLIHKWNARSVETL